LHQGEILNIQLNANELCIPEHSRNHDDSEYESISYVRVSVRDALSLSVTYTQTSTLYISTDHVDLDLVLLVLPVPVSTF